MPGAALASSHGTAALRTEQLTTKKIGLHIANISTCAICGTGRKNLLIDLLYRVKQFLADDWRMRVWNGRPLLSWLTLLFFVQMVSGYFPIGAIADIDIAADDLANGRPAPQCVTVRCGAVHSTQITQLSGGRNMFLIQLFCYGVEADALGTQGKDTPDDRSGVLINVIGRGSGVPEITVRNAAGRRQIGAAAHLCVDAAADFSGDILGVVLVHDHFQRHGEGRGSACILHETVIVVIDADKAHVHGGEYLLHQFAGLDEMTSQARDVLDDNAVDLAAPYIRHHLMKCRTVVVHTGIAIVSVPLDNLDVGVLRKESVDDFCLIADGISFGIVAVLHR